MYRFMRGRSRSAHTLVTPFVNRTVVESPVRLASALCHPEGAAPHFLTKREE